MSEKYRERERKNKRVRNIHSHTHKHTHTNRERERERAKNGFKSSDHLSKQNVNVGVFVMSSTFQFGLNKFNFEARTPSDPTPFGRKTFTRQTFGRKSFGRKTFGRPRSRLINQLAVEKC